MLKSVVSLEQENYLFRKLKVPFFRWTCNIKTNGDIQPVWAHLIPDNFELKDFYSSTLAHSIISIAINLKSKGQNKRALELKPILKSIKAQHVPSNIRIAFPDLFD